MLPHSPAVDFFVWLVSTFSPYPHGNSYLTLALQARSPRTLCLFPAPLLLKYLLEGLCRILPIIVALRIPRLLSKKRYDRSIFFVTRIREPPI